MSTKRNCIIPFTFHRTQISILSYLELQCLWNKWTKANPKKLIYMHNSYLVQLIIIILKLIYYNRSLNFFFFCILTSMIAWWLFSTLRELRTATKAEQMSLYAGMSLYRKWDNRRNQWSLLPLIYHNTNHKYSRN